MIISNTQVGTKLLCDKQHDFRFMRAGHGYEPKKLPPAIYRGILGHSALEQYYFTLKEGFGVGVASSAAQQVLDTEISRLAAETPGEFETVGLILQLKNLVELYAQAYREETFKVLEVEKDFRTSVDENIEYALKLDLLVEMTSGEFRGDLVVVDHKFVYNFKTPLDIEMDAQLPKYIHVLKQNGYTVSKGMFNQIRTRSLKNPTQADLFRREWIKPTKSEINQIWFEQKEAAYQIHRDQDYSNTPIRNMSLLVCRSCMFQQPCKAELNGDDVTQMLKANYQKSTYGYTELGEE